MKKILFLLLVVILTSSCVSTRGRAVRVMERWNGKSKQELVSHWGTPTETTKTDEGEILEYIEPVQYSYKKPPDRKIQFYLDSSGTIYNSSFQYCPYGYIIERARR